MTVAHTDTAVAELDSLDQGARHLWCTTCHPDWASRQLGAELGVPFTAFCGVRAIILVPSPVDLPADSCGRCLAADACPVCGTP